MEHILTHILLPGTGQCETFVLPTDIPFREMLSDIVLQMNAEPYVDQASCVLCDKQKHVVLDLNETVRNLNVKNGAVLLLC